MRSRPRFFVSSPPKSRQAFRWVLGKRWDMTLTDWSYGHNIHTSYRKALAQAKRAKVLWPNRQFRVDRLNWGGTYTPLRLIP